MNRLSLFLKITAVIFLTFFLGNLNIIAQATVCPTTSSYTYDNYYGPSDAVDFVVANPTDLITMTFTSGSTESCCDDWYITDGAGGTGNIIASGSGSISTSTPYTSTTGTISFYVDADGSVTGSTFNFSVTCSSPATCAAPTTPIVSGITESTVDYTFTDNASASQWQIAWGTTGFDPTTATLDATNSSIENSTNTGISGLTSETDYVVYVRAICGAGDTSDWSSAESFTTAIACPAGAICASYTGGQTSTDYSFSSSTGSSCPSSVSVTIPSGYQLDSVSIDYEMVAQGGGWKSEQRSFLGCSSLGTREVSTYSGSGSSGGAQSYSRSGLTFAQGGTGTLNFELHAGRTYGGS
ncbi:MAG: fibronectin type III domain-containing protein, partial [Bacteroidota bacterium]|nr:fibronectin type III domain-containing protein [Bacteroidota bacterium]